MKNEILQLLKEINKVKSSLDSNNKLPENCYFLKNNNILVMPSNRGVSRYPYASDGFTMWAYSSGIITLNESNFFIFPPTLEGKEPYFSFYGGIRNPKTNKYDVYSLTGSADTEKGREEEIYIVYNPQYFYFIRKINQVLFSIKGTVTKDKKVVFLTNAINLSKKEKEVFISAYMNPLLTHSSYENEETKWFRTCSLANDGASFVSVEDLSREVHLHNYMVVKKLTNANEMSSTSLRKDYVGNKNYSISQSSCLRNGQFEHANKVSSFIDMAAYGDINKKSLNKNEELSVSYKLTVSFDEKDFEVSQKETLNREDLENSFLKSKKKNVEIKFGKFNDLNLNNNLFNQFVNSVINQVDYCSKAKNSSLMLLGIRDVYQMMEISLLWDKDTARKKILDSLSYLDISGRAPRQYAGARNGKEALFDNREFIDQGEWIITTIHHYLAFTNDFSILKEKCGYYELKGKGQGSKLNKVDSVYDHLVKIMDFLCSNLDEENHLLHTLYGDWNDAVDGLGTSKDKEFGNGVSVMASEHLYKNLLEMHEINEYLHKEDNYLEIANKILEGFKKHAVTKKDNVTKILHGWGEDKSFTVGGFVDADKKNRYSLTSYAFYPISRMYEVYPDLKEACLNAYKHLDSKYGFKTFDEYFDKKDAYMVGRIVNLPRGTAENAATYIHASMFAVRSLLKMNEGKLAFEQLYKLIPITHEKISVSPFVMPNSYGFNPDLGIDGESMNDWYTGSSNTLLKAIFFDLFGIRPHLENKLEIKPIEYYPSDEIDLNLKIKNKKCHIAYRNAHQCKRLILVNKKPLIGSLIELDNVDKLEIEILD